MKTKVLKEKRLTLNKISIARLDNNGMDQVKGGIQNITHNFTPQQYYLQNRYGQIVRQYR